MKIEKQVGAYMPLAFILHGQSLSEREMKRQNSSVSSLPSLRRSNSTDIISGKSTGCMSGVITLLSKYLTHRKKRISFVSATKSQADDSFRSPNDSCPMTIIHVRRPSSPDSTPTLVARLMGLEKPPPEVDSPATEEQKRRTLLGALEECDKELKAVKKILTTVYSGETLRSPALVLDKRVCSEDQKAETTRRLSSYTNDIKFRGSLQAQGRKQALEEQLKLRILEKLKELGRPIVIHGQTAPENEDSGTEARWRRSRRKKELDMKESVEEVWGDIAWGEKREMGRIGVSLQHQICRDLIGEIVADMGLKTCLHSRSLTFHAGCRRRLCY